METLLVFLSLSVFIIGGIVIVQLYVLNRKRREVDATKAQLEEMLVRQCGHAISRYRMQFFRLPKNDVGYLTRVKLSHEADMPEFYIAFGNAEAEVLGYACFRRQESRGHKQSYVLAEILPASVPVPCRTKEHSGKLPLQAGGRLERLEFFRLPPVCRLPCRNDTGQGKFFMNLTVFLLLCAILPCRSGFAHRTLKENVSRQKRGP